MNRKNLNYYVIALMLMLSIPGIYCTKKDISKTAVQEQTPVAKTIAQRNGSADSAKAETALAKKEKTKTDKEKVLTTVSSKINRSSGTLSTSAVSCYGMAFGENYTQGYYTYPAQNMNFAGNLYGTVTLDLHAYGVPNRFRVMTPENTTLTVSDWLGDVSYSGPWGDEIHTDNGTLTFQVTSSGDYTLIVETQVDDVSDYWEAMTDCTPPQYSPDINSLSNQDIITIYSNVGSMHNDGLNYVLNSLKSYYGSVYTGSNSKLAHDAMFQKIDDNTKNFMMNNYSVSQTDADNCIANFQTVPVSNMGSNLSTNVTYSPYYSSLSSAFLNAVAQLNSLIYDSINCYTKSYYDNIVNNNISLLSSNNEKVYLVSMCSIGYSSMIYWRDNITAWEDFFGYSSIGFNQKNPALLIGALGLSTANHYFFKNSPAKEIAVADVAGIVTGAVGGCAWGAAGGTLVVPGAGTVAGCAGVGAVSALGGGLGNSAKKAVEHFFSWLMS